MPASSVRGGLSDGLLQFFRQQGETKDYPPKAGLLRQDEAIDRIHLIESGLVKLTRANARGREVTVALRHPTVMLGAASAIFGKPASASALTLEPSRISSVSAKTFLRQVETIPDFMAQVLRAVAQNYHEQTLHLGRLGALSAHGRVASLLLQFVPAAEQNQSKEIRLQLPINQIDAAGLLFISKEHYNRMLKKLEEAGLIRRGKRSIYIRDLESLKREAGE